MVQHDAFMLGVGPTLKETELYNFMVFMLEIKQFIRRLTRGYHRYHRVPYAEFNPLSDFATKCQTMIREMTETEFANLGRVIDWNAPIDGRGFLIDPVSLNCLPVQKFMPFLTEFDEYSTDVYAKGFAQKSIFEIKTINEVGEAVTHTICRALLIPEYRETIKEGLKQIPTPFNNPNKRDMEGWARLVRKTFEDILTRPPTIQKDNSKSPELFFALRDDP